MSLKPHTPLGETPSNPVGKFSYAIVSTLLGSIFKPSLGPKGPTTYPPCGPYSHALVDLEVNSKKAP